MEGHLAVRIGLAWTIRRNGWSGWQRWGARCARGRRMWAAATPRGHRGRRRAR